jgi:hypothetical protein
VTGAASTPVVKARPGAHINTARLTYAFARTTSSSPAWTMLTKLAVSQVPASVTGDAVHLR